MLLRYLDCVETDCVERLSALQRSEPTFAHVVHSVQGLDVLLAEKVERRRPVANSLHPLQLLNEEGIQVLGLLLHNHLPEHLKQLLNREAAGSRHLYTTSVKENFDACTASRSRTMSLCSSM
uniref:Uncharacterized protein n=1 Tax=Chrysotila carterae TaxID=13221 RepID=A0A7S4C5P2_CHRCT